MTFLVVPLLVLAPGGITAGEFTALRADTGGTPPRTVWDELAACESNETWDIVSPPHYGGLQWTLGTWAAVRPDGAPANPADASREQEIAAAERLMSLPWGGWHHWPVCSRLIGVAP